MCRAHHFLPIAACGLLMLAAGTAADEGEPTRAADVDSRPKAAESKAPGAPTRTVIDLQTTRRSRTMALVDAGGARGSATLTDLAPGVGNWHLLEVALGPGPAVYHLEVAEPRRTRLELVGDGGGALVTETDGRAAPCRPWIGGADSELRKARETGLPFAPICDRRIYVRNPVAGRRSTIERTTDFLRDRVRGGEKITTFVRDTVFKDKYRQVGATGSAEGVYREPAGAPPPVAIAPPHAGAAVRPSGLALALESVSGSRLEAGRWYAATGVTGVFVTALLPSQVPGLGESLRGQASPLDDVEAGALAYLVAFDLESVELGFALGTDHPRLVWSDRAPEAVRDPALPGPDAVATAAPLARAGMLNPRQAMRVAATFTGGFKRTHGAFKYGDLSRRNGASHYGFVEQGAVMSRLQPGLATAVVWTDGQAELLTWTRDLDARLAEVRHARQNGVAVVETDPATGAARPGALVVRWADGNWSGSADGKLRTLRSGLCQVDTGGRRYLLYGYFSTATPSAMARVFLAAGCGYAMHLDMNALEHTYLALYRTSGERFLTEHLIDGMAVLDPERGAEQLPRFVAVPDNRDFFYLLQRAAP